MFGDSNQLASVDIRASNEMCFRKLTMKVYTLRQFSD